MSGPGRLRGSGCADADMLKRLDEYYLNMPAGEVFGLKELNPVEYAMFEAAGVKMILPGEKMYHGRNILLAGAVWKTVLGTTGGRIYRIAAQTMTPEKDVSEKVFGAVYGSLSEEMGPGAGGPAQRYLIWDTPEGNVILEMCRAEESFVVQICLTSSFIKLAARKSGVDCINSN